MENNLDNLQEDEVIIEDIDVDTLQTLDETLEQDITEAKAKKEDHECDCEKGKCDCDEDEMGEDEMGEATKVDPKSIDGKDDDDKEDDGEGLDKTGDEDSDVDNDGDSDEADEYLTKRRKTVAKKLAKEETEMETEEKIEESNIQISSEDIDQLISSEEGLTEEFKEKASIIFEAAVSSKVNEIETTLREQYETRLSEEVESVKSVLEEQVDNYLTYAVESWMEENKVAIESSLRTQLAENFISALKTVFVENYVDVPDSKVDLFAQLEAENSSLKEESAKFNRIAESLADRVDSLVREQIVTEASTGLADTQVDRLKKLVEDVEFVDEATYRKKVATIKEFYLNGAQDTEDTTLTEDTDNSFTSIETIIEGEETDNNLSPEMKSYLTALSRMSKAVTSDLL